MARDSGMSTGPDGGGGGLGGLGGGSSRGGRGTGAGADNIFEQRRQEELQKQQAGIYTQEQRRLQMELNKALIDGDMDLAKQLQADIAHVSQNPTQGSSPVLGRLPPGWEAAIGNGQGSVVHDGYYSLNDKHFAEKTFAAVTRAQYADWEKRFLPRQRELMELAKNESLAKEQLARTDGLVANSLRQAQLGQDNRMARMGVATQKDSNDNSLGLRQSLITAGTKNATRTHEKDRQLGILTGADAGTREKLQDGGVT